MEGLHPLPDPPNSLLVRSPAAKRTRGDESTSTNGLGTQQQFGKPRGENTISFKDAILKQNYLLKLTWEEVLEDDTEDTDMGGNIWDCWDSEKERSKWPQLKVSKEEHESLCQPWKQTLIVKVLGKSVGYNFLLNRLRQIWNLQQDFSLMDLDNDYFLVRVRNPDDYNTIVSGGPWIVVGHYLTMRKWKPLFRPCQASITSTTVWVRFPGLPIEFFNRAKLTEAGNLLGRTIKVDKPTDSSSRGKYARVCVEVELGKPLIGGIMVGPFWQKVEYEGLDEICFDCGIYGHKTSECHQRIFKANNETTTPHESDVAVVENQGHNQEDPHQKPQFGPWMLVQKRNKKPPNKGVVSSSRTGTTGEGSRFAPLETIGEEDAGNSGKTPVDNDALETHQAQMRNELKSKSSASIVKPKPTKGKSKALSDITNGKPNQEKPMRQTGVKISEPSVNNITPDNNKFSIGNQQANPTIYKKTTRVKSRSVVPTPTNLDLSKVPVPPAFSNIPYPSSTLSPSSSTVNPSSIPSPPTLESNPPKVNTNEPADNEIVMRMEPNPNAPPILVETSISLPLRWLRRVDSKVWTESADSIDNPLYNSQFPMKILLWNVRGAGNNDFLRNIRELIRSHRPSLVGIMETRVSNERADDIIRRVGYQNSTRVDGLGFADGIWLLWNEEEVDVTVEHSNFQSITVNIRRKEGNLRLTTVYGSPTPSNREQLWDTLKELGESSNDPWVVGGDFNEIATASEKSNFKDSDCHRCRRMQEALQACNLIDLGFIGPKFTWHKSPNSLLSSWENHDAPIQSKLTKFAEVVKKWNKSSFGNIFQKKKRLLARLRGIQKARCNGENPFLVALEKELQHEYSKVLRQEELLWFQKARTKWIQSGDRNTTYFHTLALVKRSRNRIRSLKDSEGNWVNDQAVIKRMAVQHYKTLYTESLEGSLRPDISVTFPRLEVNEIEELHKPVDDDEVKEAMFSIGPHKAPGPDGFQARFFQKNWDTVGEAVTKSVKEAFSSGEVPLEMNKTLITLIPKVKSPESMNQLRPISLCNILYNLITKIIVNRLKQILPKLVSPMQSSFVPGRQIVDNIVVVQEMLHSFKKRKGKTGALAWKIDLEKTYDKMNWEFVRETLMEIGFNSTLLKLVMNCIQTTSFQILWNGEATEEFKPKGDYDREIPFPHISATPCQTKIVMVALKEFNLWTGQSVSLAKSKLCASKNTRKMDAKNLSNQTGIPLTSDLGKYLGVPFIHGRVSKKTYWHIVERVQEKFASWKINHLSLAGRTVLIKSAASPVPIYTMQTARLPLSVCDEIAKRSRGFLWGSSAEKRKIHLVNWEQVCMPKNQAGLGFRASRDVNLALLAKMGWRLMEENDKLWARVMTSKYLRKKEFLKVENKNGGSFGWRSILAGRNIVKGAQMESGIMHNRNRVVRNLTEDPSCKQCGAANENTLHVLRDCPHAKEVWNHWVGASDTNFFRCSEAQWWNANLIDQKNRLIGDWPWSLIFAVTAWRIWKWRNEGCFANKSYTVSTKLAIIGKILKEAIDFSNRKMGQHMRREVLIGWEKPKEGQVKINTDGSWFQRTNEAAVGGVVRGSCGEWLLGFSQSVGECSIDLAELWGILQGLSLAWSRGFNDIVVESDSATSVDMIKKGVNKNHPHFCIIAAIQDYLSKEWTCQLHYIPREKNFVADWMAKNSSDRHEGIMIYNTPPAGVLNLLIADAVGVAFPRMVT
ncbi:reverse transcriptase [Corchorus capsularis]|uniref:Reverse transcriptase n=1 Tax=Corchorus capsularis TaxID=210143 RepID=A0A1R3H693_COCAP|nr:reverse transcriptase [Corchorus capsularis]